MCAWCNPVIHNPKDLLIINCLGTIIDDKFKFPANSGAVCRKGIYVLPEDVLTARRHPSEPQHSLSKSDITEFNEQRSTLTCGIRY